MRQEKFSERVLKRSVLKQIKTKREEVVRGADVGTDCSFFTFDGEEGTLLSVTPVMVDDGEDILSGIRGAVNNVAAAAGEPVGILVSWLFPHQVPESTIQEYCALTERVCGELNLQTAGGNMQITQGVKQPVLNITVVGKKRKKYHKSYNQYEGGEDIVLTKWIGLLGTSALADKRKDELKKRLPGYLIEEAVKFRNMISVLPESRIAAGFGAKGMHDVSRGGILAALWELAEGAGMGLEVNLKNLPIRQETVEICEILEVNPYELHGAGALLIVTKEGSSLVQQLEKEDIPAAIIGQITRDNSKVILNGEEKRFLDKPGGK